MTELSGLRVLDLTDEKGIYGTKLLADHGAHVIRVEPPGGHHLRRRGPFLRDDAARDHSLYWAYMNTSKRAITLNVDTADGRDLFSRLVATVDVVAVSGDPAPVARLDPRGLVSAHPALIVSAITPFGMTGPFQNWAGNDFIAWATGGLTFTTGDSDRPPVSPAPVAELANVYAGYLTAFSTLAALVSRNLSGRGQLLDLSLQQSVLIASGESGISAFMNDQELRVRQGSKRIFGPSGHYPTSDGHAAVLALMPPHWDALAAWIAEETGLEGALDESLRGAMVRTGDLFDVSEYFTTELTKLYTKQELFEEGQRRGIPFTPVNEPASTAHDPQLAYRGFWTDLEVAGESVRAPGAPATYSGIEWRAGRPPRLAEHNEEVYAEIGLTREDIERLTVNGVL